MINLEDTEVFGTIVSFTHDKGTLSAPSFLNIAIQTEAGYREVYAQGKLVKRLAGKLSEGQRVTLTLDDNRILTFESYGE